MTRQSNTLRAYAENRVESQIDKLVLGAVKRLRVNQYHLDRRQIVRALRDYGNMVFESDVAKSLQRLRKSGRVFYIFYDGTVSGWTPFGWVSTADGWKTDSGRDARKELK